LVYGLPEYISSKNEKRDVLLICSVIKVLSVNLYSV
jgi:hypothetical protein